MAVSMTPLKRRLEFTDPDNLDDSGVRLETNEVLASPRKKLKLHAKALPSSIQDQASENEDTTIGNLMNSLAGVCLDQTDGSSEDYSQGYSSSIPTKDTEPETPPASIEPVLALYLQTEMQGFVLVKPSFASGSFAHCSIWLGLTDRKLYVRKLQVDINREPRDITHYVPHPSVPALVADINHGRNPTPWQAGRSIEGRARRRDGQVMNTYWTTMTEFINGPTLLKVVNNAAAPKYRIPEPAIWQCGATLLDIVRKFSFPEKHDPERIDALWHNDIFPRNIIVENCDEDQYTSRFHLIDFGVSSRAIDKVSKPHDLWCILDVLYCMTLSYNEGGGVNFRGRVERARLKGDWPYSPQLAAQLFWMSKIEEETGGLPRESRYDQWIRTFNIMARKSTKKLVDSGKTAKIQLSPALTDKQPWLFGGENTEAYMMSRVVGKEAGCTPFQKAWLNLENLEVEKIEDVVVWHKREDEVRVPRRK